MTRLERTLLALALTSAGNAHTHIASIEHDSMRMLFGMAAAIFGAITLVNAFIQKDSDENS
jgi:hypothetical protein